MKCGPKSSPEDIVKSIKLLNPENELGKLWIIIRFGADNIKDGLPKFIQEIVNNELNVVWIWDPVHGNTYTNDCNFKVRDVQAVLSELVWAYKILNQHKQVFGGIHIESSGDNVTEWVNGIDNLTDSDLSSNYTTQWDPRLNFAQTLHVIYKLCEAIKEHEE